MCRGGADADGQEVPGGGQLGGLLLTNPIRNYCLYC